MSKPIAWEGIHYYVLDKTHNLIHFNQNCPKIGKDTTLFESSEFAEYSDHWRIQICKRCSDDTSHSLTKGLVFTVVGLCLFPLVSKYTQELFKQERLAYLWIKPIYGKPVKMPIHQALRIARKHHWRIVETIPKPRNFKERLNIFLGRY